MTVDQLRGYREWKRAVPLEVRALVEGKMLGKKARFEEDDLPSVAEFYRGVRRLLEDPFADATGLDVSPVVARQLAALQTVRVGEESLNLFAALGDADLDFALKSNYVRAKLLPRLDFLRLRDRRLAEETRADGATGVTGERGEEEYEPHRAASEETEGVPAEAVATVSPYFGGYYADAQFDRFDPATLRWSMSPRTSTDLPPQRLVDARRRAYRSVVLGSGSVVKMPDGWSADAEKVVWHGPAPESFRFMRDQGGRTTLNVTGPEVSYPFSVDIAPSPTAATPLPPEGDVTAVPDRFPDELIAFANELMAARLPLATKARRLASRVRSHLEYDMDPKWEAVYKADPSNYFEEIWANKKAKCDEANTMLARLLMKMGIHARFIGGHSVRAKSPRGEALLLEGNRHAWVWVWDTETRKWIRLDATPAGDPNVGEEQQEADLGEGDYGEQEAELMDDAELDRRIAAAEREERAREERANPEAAYARDAGCSPEEARAVIRKIVELRVWHADVLRDAARRWQKLVRENVRETVVDRGPVPMSRMDEIDPDELVAGYVEIAAGERDPLIGEREGREQKKEKWFGGYEVYVAADMSGSMVETVDGVKKSDAQRDMAFLLVDSCMSAALEARQAERRLLAPMPVKVSVTVFGSETRIVLPLTETWGPKEQITLYRALDAGAGGGTPDDAALRLVLGQTSASEAEEERARQARPDYRRHGWNTRRFVITTADGESNSPGAVKAANGLFADAGIPVDLLLIGAADDINLKRAAELAYPSVIPVSSVGDLARVGLARLTERIAKAYEGKKS